MLRRFRPLEWLRDHPDTTDVLLAAVVTCFAVVTHLWEPETAEIDPRDPTWWTTGLMVMAAAPIAFRRRAPIATLLVAASAQTTADMASAYGGGWAGVVVAVYSLGAYSSGARRVAAAVTLGVVIAVTLVVQWQLDLGYTEINLGSVVGIYAIVIASLIVGDNVKRRRQHVVDLAERAERAERERDLIARERVNEERARIARDLHDIVAHSVSAMVIQATAARRSLDHAPETSRDLLHSIEHTGRQALDELRRVLGVLRDHAATSDRTPQPSLDNVDALIAAHSDLPLTVTVDGEMEMLPPGVALSAYRVLQEALTNVRRHAGTVTRVGVNITADDDGLDVKIDDDGRGAAASAVDGEHGGYGLIGMRERVSAAGGELRVGPRTGGGWAVTAHFPGQSS